MNMKKDKEIKGLYSIQVFIPAIFIISTIYIIMIISTVLSHNSAEQLLLENSTKNDCINEISTLQSTVSKMSETATTFVYNPTVINPQTNKPVIKENGMETVIAGPLLGYLEDYLDDTKYPSNILQRIKKYDIDEYTNALLTDAVKKASIMLEYQAKAFRLINSISTIEIDIYNKLPQYKLSDEDLALSDDDKRETAFKIVMSTDYSNAKGDISKDARTASQNITDSYEKTINNTISTIKWTRGVLWGSITLALIVNSMLFFVLLKRLVFPITRFSRQIENNKKLNARHGLYEANYLAKAYNNLFDRHKEFENQLRDTAEIDSLTGLPNRYCYNEYLNNFEKNEESICIIVLDINDLKKVNDKQGHLEGDKLIKNASCCIKDSFLCNGGKNCFRIGGDEFVAIIRNKSEEDILKMIETFNEKQKEYNVVIALGYAYYNDSNEEFNFENLIAEADEKMYINKDELKKAKRNKK